VRTSITFGLYELEDSGPRSHQGQNGVFGYLQKNNTIMTDRILGNSTDIEIGPRSHKGQNGVFGYLQKQLVVLRTSCILGDGTDFETRTY